MHQLDSPSIEQNTKFENWSIVSTTYLNESTDTKN